MVIPSATDAATSRNGDSEYEVSATFNYASAVANEPASKAVSSFSSASSVTDPLDDADDDNAAYDGIEDALNSS